MRASLATLAARRCGSWAACRAGTNASALPSFRVASRLGYLPVVRSHVGAAPTTQALRLTSRRLCTKPPPPPSGGNGGGAGSGAGSGGDSASKAALNAQRARELDMLDPTPLPKYHIPPPPPPPTQSANPRNIYTVPVAMAAGFALLVYASYKSLNTAQIRLIMEDHSPSWVTELQQRGLLLPFSEVVVSINRTQLAERIFVVTAETDGRISKERALEVATSIGSPTLARMIESVLASRKFEAGEFLPADQFMALFAQATVEDVPDDHMYFAVRATYDIVPVHRKVKAMLANLHNQCLRHGATFSPEQVAELCEKLSVLFDGDEESSAELAHLTSKHAFVDYFARKFEGIDVATVLVRLKALLMYSATHQPLSQLEQQPAQSQ